MTCQHMRVKERECESERARIKKRAVVGRGWAWACGVYVGFFCGGGGGGGGGGGQVRGS